MHLDESVLSLPIVAVTTAGAVAGVGVGLRRVPPERIPAVGIMASTFFVASLIHVPIPPAKAHLVLTGLTGLVLGWGAFPAIGAALILQTLFFGYGGLTTWGANTLTMALPALLCHGLFGGHVRRGGRRAAAAGACAGALGVMASGLLLAGLLRLTGEEFSATAIAVVLIHLPVIPIEGAVTAAAVGYLARVAPRLLSGPATREAAA